MADDAAMKETCIQEPCFFLPFFESGEWRTKEKPPWKTLKKAKVTPGFIRSLATYTEYRMKRSADLMEYLLSLEADWDVTMKKDGIYVETKDMIYERILPKIHEAGFTEDDYVLYSEYTRKWGML
ncbi:hypothetical protein [Gordonibacter sp.]|uniref:hypothetical protein n=1 Tax=Gordonibacter sp. TaxID=1968902 RepID=UPI002FC707C1